jgi:hemin uptake protein HemP
MQTTKSGIRAPFPGINQHPAAHQKTISITPQQTDASTYAASELFGLKNEIGILHRGERYQLRITSLGKLILTK